MDKLIPAYGLTECQKHCENEKYFNCRSINYESYSRDCALSSNDISSIGVGQTALLLRRNSLYSEKGNCEQGNVHHLPLSLPLSLSSALPLSPTVTVQCNQQDMMLTLNFDTPFYGRVYAKGNPTVCYLVGTGQTSLQFAISLGSRCGTRQEVTTHTHLHIYTGRCVPVLYSSLIILPILSGSQEFHQRGRNTAARGHHDRLRSHHKGHV